MSSDRLADLVHQFRSTSPSQAAVAETSIGQLATDPPAPGTDMFFASDTTQPSDAPDLAPVLSASLADLDQQTLTDYLARLRAADSRSVRGLTDTEALSSLRILVGAPGDRSLHPSLGALLVFGRNPQAFFPRLGIGFAVYPGPTRASAGTVTRRTLEGPIPDLISDALALLADTPEPLAFPQAGLGEAIVNALLHRDYSPSGLQAAVTIEVFSDRVVVRSPGGLVPGTSPAELGVESLSRTRNPHLARLLQDVALPATGEPICENQGVGIARMIESMRAEGLYGPGFAALDGQFAVTFSRTMVHSQAADQPTLFARKPVPLAPRSPRTPVRRRASSERAKQVIGVIEPGEEITSATIMERSGLSYPIALRAIKALIRDGELIATAPATSKRRAYRLPN